MTRSAEKRIRLMAATVTFAGGLALGAQPAAVRDPGPCDEAQVCEAWGELEAYCDENFSNPPTEYWCAQSLVWCTYWDDPTPHIEWFGTCYDNGEEPCPPPMIC